MKLFVDHAGTADRGPGLADLRRVAQDELALAVITQAPCLEYAGSTDFANRANQLLFAVDRRMRGNGDSQLGKQRLFRHAVLGHLERLSRRANSRQFLERRKRFA